MGQSVCMPWTEQPCSVNPAAGFAPQSVPNPIGNAPQLYGCVPSLTGLCGGGASGSLPQAGPDTFYFASGETDQCNCLAGSTPLLLWGGGTTTAEALQVGDRVVGLDASWAQAEQTVTSIGASHAPCMKISFGATVVTCTVGQPFYASRTEQIKAGHLKVGSSVLDIDGNALTVTAIDHGPAFVVYCIQTSPDLNFVGAIAETGVDATPSGSGGGLPWPVKGTQH